MKKTNKLLSLALCSLFAVSAIGCGGGISATPKNTDPYDIPQDNCRTYYEVFVRSFADGNGDGIGDIKGLIKNLDYLNDGDDSTTTDLGVNGIWLMPINSSPSYHKYDVADYYNIDDEYGTLDDFDELVKECNKRNIWIQMDLVLNHTSTQHPWFQAAVADAKAGKSPASSENMAKYCFYKTGTEPHEGEAKYSRVSGSLYNYLSNFDSSMPDLNLNNEAVRAEIEKIVDFWLGRGVRSFRLDAVPWACGYTAADSGDANMEFWTWFNDYCNAKGAEIYGKPDDGIDRYCYNVGEVWSGKSTIMPYYGTGMTCFNYVLGGGTPYVGFAGVINERISAYKIAQDVQTMQTEALSNSPDALLSNFLTNHDNMRSAEYMFGADPVKIKKAAGLYLLMPGNPYIYYGEEIGAIGSTDGDPGKRRAFNWGDKKKGIATDPPGTGKEEQTLGTWKKQTTDPNSILTYYRNAIKLRNRFPEIGRGVMTSYGVNKAGAIEKAADISTTEPLYIFNELNEYITAYTVTWGERSALILHNFGAKSLEFGLGAFSAYSVVGTLKAQGGGVSINDGKIAMSAGTTAVLKAGA